MTDKNIDALKEIIENSKKIVFFGGAGVSTDNAQLHRTEKSV